MATTMDLSPVPDPRLQKPVLPLAQGAPATPDPQPVEPVSMPTATVPAMPEAGAAQPAENLNKVPLAFPQLGQQNETQNQQTLRQTQQRGSGISNIHNPVLRTAAQIGDILLGDFAPRAERLTPGTEGNYALHLARAGNAVAGEREGAKAQGEQNLQSAQALHSQAQARLANTQADVAEEESKKNVIALGPNQGAYDLKANKWLVEPTAKDEEKTTEVDPEIGAKLGIQPTKDGRYLVPNQALGALLKPKVDAAPKTLLEKKMLDNPEMSADELQTWLAKQPKETQLSADDEAILKAVGGDPRVDIRDQPTAIVNKFLARKRQQTEPDRGQNFVDPANNRMVRVEPGGTVPQGALTAAGESRENATPVQMLNREGQARIIRTAGDQLIASIEQNRDKIGNLGSYWKQYTNGTPISDPATAGLMAQLASFAALQPTLHGFRSEAALKGFENIIGGVPKNPDALEAAIKAIQGTAGIIENGGGRRNEPGGGATAQTGGLPEVSTVDQYNALPEGAFFTQGGEKRQKPKSKK